MSGKRSEKQRNEDDEGIQLSLDLESAIGNAVAQQSEQLPQLVFPPIHLPESIPVTSIAHNVSSYTPQSVHVSSAERIKALQDWHRQNWGTVFRETHPLEPMLQHLDPLLGWLRGKRSRSNYWVGDYPLNIHRLEKDLLYLVARVITQRSPLFLSFPVSLVALGILTIAYYANLPREGRDLSSTNHAVKSKAFVIWIRSHDNGQIQNLRIKRASNEQVNLSDRLTCMPAYRFSESEREERLKVVTARSLSEGMALLEQSKYCALVVLDDPSGRTYLSPSQYGGKAFELAKICRRKASALIGIVPPWTMRAIEHHENEAPEKVLLWAIDSAALRSYPTLSSPFASSEQLHPIEKSYQALNRKCEFGTEAQVTIKTFGFDADDENRIAEAFQEASNLLISLAERPELRSVWTKGWEIWRDLAAPFLPSHLLWENFLQDALSQLESASQRCGATQARVLYQVLHSLARRLQKLTRNPFIEEILLLDSQTTIAVADIVRAEVLDRFLTERCPENKPKVMTIGELREQSGNRLVIIGQPKARYRDLLQTTLFHQVDVLLWGVLANRAEHWWTGLEINPRTWHDKTWRSLTDQEWTGRYEYSYHPRPVRVIHTGQVNLHRAVDLSRLEERFSEIDVDGSSLDSGLLIATGNSLNAHYWVELERNYRIRVSPNSEFIVLTSNGIRIVSIRDLTIGTRVVLFEGMNRDELFAQKVGLLEETRDNHLYRAYLEGWRTLVKQMVERSDLWSICRRIFRDTGIEISESAVRQWITGDDLLTLPRAAEHFFWFIPVIARPGFQELWQKANLLRERRRQLGKIISACAQEGWSNRHPDQIVFQYQQVFITVGELRDAMQILTVAATPQFIQSRPEYPFNRLFRFGA